MARCSIKTSAAESSRTCGSGYRTSSLPLFLAEPSFVTPQSDSAELGRPQLASLGGFVPRLRASRLCRTAMHRDLCRGQGERVRRAKVVARSDACARACTDSCFFACPSYGRTTRKHRFFFRANLGSPLGRRQRRDLRDLVSSWPLRIKAFPARTAVSIVTGGVVFLCFFFVGCP